MGADAIVQAILGIVGMAIDENAKSGARDSFGKGTDQLKAISSPELKKMVAEQLGVPEASIPDDALLGAQRQALQQMQQYAKGEVTSADRAQMALAENEGARRGQVQQAAILQGAQQRGQLGSGAQLALQGQAAQGQNENAYNMALKNMVDMRNRQFAATGQSGQMAGQMGQQDFQRKSASDAVQAANARARMQAQGYNLGNPQREWENKIRQWGLETGRSDQAGAQNVKDTKELTGQLGTMGAGFGQLANTSGTSDQTGGVGKRTWTDKYGKLHDYEE